MAQRISHITLSGDNGLTNMARENTHNVPKEAAIAYLVDNRWGYARVKNPEDCEVQV